MRISTKIWLFVLATIAVTVLFMYSMTNYLYERLYVQDSKNSMVEIGGKLAHMYEGGKVTDKLVADVDRYNSYSNINVFAVRNPRELSACVPFDIDYDTLIGPEERQQLIKGNIISKQGYEKRFDRQVISVVIPLVDEKRLEGILYLYFPLEKITELASKEVIFLLISAIVFLIIIGFIIFKGIGFIMKPLRELQNAAQKMAKGDYSTRVETHSKDEIGQLGATFNEMAKSIEQEDQQQRQFLENVSHELRTPISYIKGYGEAILSNMIKEEEKADKIQLIVREAGRMEKLTNELLQLSRTKEQQEPIQLYPLPLAETIRDVVGMMTQRAEEASIDLAVTLDDEVIINANEVKMKQILINLLENAIRYSEKDTAIHIHCKQLDEKAYIIVEDHGIGIPKEDLTHVTERFYRVNKARSRVDGGSGLGLSIVNQLVQAHAGHLNIESELNKGTVITLTFPTIEENE
ncbi:two-component sensor histidine kinase [Kurthia zopfii]|uniref:histidine kinase n=1 Tax=Kurthia zopfii TaxID=1650 RepID=A0A2U3AGX1_9BACL|nr:ATP-binding protein [Kurthia zopfii]PWI23796.1 two-component sensor histidine kinase [Kurthia zopfii]TDR43371.1 signal transduction histidine kinase [Kurthia zopfii]STX10624.1 Signal transduction histidine-protein kinase BaeS [Kurthia zopfii]VEI06002.1 Signal transduction histidine-protein kinase BaeS [Kurthia zopfii]GEK31917.1 two-component sensor histidine kinase [Kurthia zopfii]